MKHLNLGCGKRYFEDWTNVDFVSNSPYVRRHDLTLGIPLPDKSFRVVYHSHVLEHFTKSYASHFIHECYRVLEKGGVIRVVVPDLEQIVRQYLDSLERAKQGDGHAAHNYVWNMLEMYDQSVRNYSGGGIAEYWMQERIKNEDYLKERMGYEFSDFREYHLQKVSPVKSSKEPGWKRYLKLSTYQMYLIRKLSGNSSIHNYITLGRFRLSGEVHQWMYDEYSLGVLLHNAGFTNITRKSAYESDIPGWEKYRTLDIEDGQVRKPDSLFMEAKK